MPLIIIRTPHDQNKSSADCYEPLRSYGLVAIFVSHGKLLVQHIWCSGFGWDEPLSDTLLDQRKRWAKLLQQLDYVAIPRCYFPDYSSEDYTSVELHVFVYTSEEAFAAVAYFRIDERTVFVGVGENKGSPSEAFPA